MRLTIYLGFLAIANVFLAFFCQWFVVTRIGVGIETDALFAGLLIPSIFLSIVSGSLTHVLVPLLSERSSRERVADAWNYVQIIGVIFVLFALLLGWGAEGIIGVLFPGFDESSRLITVRLARIQLVGMVFVSLASVLWAVNHANKKFLFVEVVAVISNVVSVVFLVVGVGYIGVDAAAWAFAIKPVTQLVFLLPSIGRFSPLNLSSGVVREGWRRVRPLLLGAGYFKTDQLLDKFLASLTANGNLTLLHLSQQIFMAGHTVLQRAVVGPMIPRLARLASEGRWRQFRKVYTDRLLLIGWVTVLFSVFVYIFGHACLELMFLVGVFDSESVEMMSNIMIALLGVWIGGAFGQVLSSSFYAYGETKLPTKIGVVGFTLGMLIKVVGFYLGGILGLACGASLYYMMNFILLYYFLSKAIKDRMNVCF
ncbi:MAG: virulence factor MviN [Gammaproteobacteria bacterium]|nr:MAG: virulence factor MviN [Gammaproteobacteria bacterium]